MLEHSDSNRFESIQFPNKIGTSYSIVLLLASVCQTTDRRITAADRTVTITTHGIIRIRTFNHPLSDLRLRQLWTFHSDRFGFRPTGSTTAALIIVTLFHSITVLDSNPFVRVIALDFSKAFDSVGHSTLLEKLAMVALIFCQMRFIRLLA